MEWINFGQFMISFVCCAAKWIERTGTEESRVLLDNF